MAHEIYNEKFVYRNQPAWHGLGQPIKDGSSVLDSFNQAGLDYPVVKQPLQYSDAQGIFWEVPNKFALVRQPTADDPNPAVFGIVSEGYQYLQNHELAMALEPLADIWPVETVGALKNGKTTFIAFDAGTRDIKGDPIQMYFTVTDTRTGTKGQSMMFTPIRTVCANTLSMGEAASVMNFSIQHQGDVGFQIEGRVQLIKELEHVRDRQMNMLTALTDVNLTRPQVEAMVDNLYPMPETPGILLQDWAEEDVAISELLETSIDKAERKVAYWSERAERDREQFFFSFDRFNDEFPQFGMTAYAFYQGVTEKEDYAPGRGDVEYQLLFGKRARTKVQAFDMAVAAAEKA